MNTTQRPSKRLNVNTFITPHLIILLVSFVSAIYVLLGVLPIEANLAFLKEGYTVTSQDREALLTLFDFAIEAMAILAIFSIFLLSTIIVCLLKPNLLLSLLNDKNLRD